MERGEVWWWARGSSSELTAAMALHRGKKEMWPLSWLSGSTARWTSYRRLWWSCGIARATNDAMVRVHGFDGAMAMEAALGCGCCARKEAKGLRQRRAWGRGGPWRHFGLTSGPAVGVRSPRRGHAVAAAYGRSATVPSWNFDSASNQLTDRSTLNHYISESMMIWFMLYLTKLEI
jgi:hypothetical protein